MMSGAELIAALEFEEFDEAALQLAASFNVAPTDPVLVVTSHGGRLRATTARWGIPRRDGGLSINARDDKLGSNPTWRRLLRADRVLIPFGGFYEWSGPRGSKQPWLFRRKDRRPMLIAALRDPESGAVVVTTGPSGDVREVHDRMPVILELDSARAWLEATRLDEALATLQPAAEGLLGRIAVSNAVNDAANDGPELAEPVRPRPQQTELFS